MLCKRRHTILVIFLCLGRRTSAGSAESPPEAEDRSGHFDENQNWHDCQRTAKEFIRRGSDQLVKATDQKLEEIPEFRRQGSIKASRKFKVLVEIERKFQQIRKEFKR
jgi:hypothetical protein